MAIIFLWVFDLVLQHFQRLICPSSYEFLQPLFSSTDGYLGLVLIFVAITFLWFIGIHEPLIVESSVAAIYYVNIAANLKFKQGQQAGRS